MISFHRLAGILICILICISLLSLGCNGQRDQTNAALPLDYQQKLDKYASASVRYFTSAESNNLQVGFPHSFYGTGPFLVRDNMTETWGENREWSMNRGYGSYTVMNEVTLRFLALAAAYKMNWLNHLPIGERYDRSWGQIQRGLQTMRVMQTSGNSDAFYQGLYYRYYETAIYDRDRNMGEILHAPGKSNQSSDDNALTFMNLLLLEGLANDSSVDIPDRESINRLCREVRDHIELRSFVVNGSIVHNLNNGKPLNGTWDRLSADGSIILAALLLSGQISEDEFYEISTSLEDKPVRWSSYRHGIIEIDKPSYHSAMFIHGLRAVHGIPVTEEEFPGLDYFDTSTRPVLEAQMDYADHHGLKALGSQVLSQELYGEPLAGRNGSLVQFPGNEDNRMPARDKNLSKATAPHAWFVPLARWRHLNRSDIDKIFSWTAGYESSFFQNGADADRELGWEAAIPWTRKDKTYAWEASDGSWRYTDWGRPFEALNTAYILLCTFDALNPDRPLASYNTEAERLKHVARYFDDGTPLPAGMF